VSLPGDLNALEMGVEKECAAAYIARSARNGFGQIWAVGIIARAECEERGGDVARASARARASAANDY
jgi:hypothetical protein